MPEKDARVVTFPVVFPDKDEKPPNPDPIVTRAESLAAKWKNIWAGGSVSPLGVGPDGMTVEWTIRCAVIEALRTLHGEE